MASAVLPRPLSALAPAVEEAVATHLDACDGCRRYLEQFNASIEAAAALREDTVPAEVRETLLAAFVDGGLTLFADFRTTWSSE